MAISNKILKKPSGSGLGQAMGGGSEFFPLSGSIAFFHDDFNTSSLDADEWDTTGTPVTGTGSIFVSAGVAVIDLGTSSTATATMTSKDKYRIPFRFIAAVGVDGYNTGMEAFVRVRDSGGTFLAEWQFTGTAGGTIHTASTRVRAGSTAAGMISSAAVEPSAVTGVAGSAGILYTIDCDYSGISFAITTGGVSTSALALQPLSPAVQSYVMSPVLKANVPYVVEFVARAGTAVEAGAVNTAANGSALLRIDFAEVRQYVPESVFQRQGPVFVYGTTIYNTAATTFLDSGLVGHRHLRWQ